MSYWLLWSCNETPIIHDHQQEDSVRVEFTLGMPNRGSWNGGWSGENARYAIVRTLTKEQQNRIGDRRYWYHNFGDGWGASVTARVMNSGERAKKSAGFCGYDWMVNSILAEGTIK